MYVITINNSNHVLIWSDLQTAHRHPHIIITPTVNSMVPARMIGMSLVSSVYGGL